MFQMMGVVAEFERTPIAERVRASLARARAEGKPLGRIARSRKTIRAANDQGRSQDRAWFGVDPGTVQRISRPDYQRR
jgi:DNA invertase Pin-like site-specific DNA recombinase